MKKEMLKKLYHTLQRSRFSPILKKLYEVFCLSEYYICCPIWKLTARKETEEDKQAVIENVTFIYKSFERQAMAKRLYRSIQKYYPGARVLICDDSAVPLKIDGAQIIYMPYNSGLGAGMKKLTEAVKTKYVMRIDDDELLTPLTDISGQLRFLEEHRDIDLSAVQLRGYNLKKPQKLASEYYGFTMSKSEKQPLLPPMTKIDDKHIVMAKTPNAFLARTESLRKVGYDEKIRMIDHHEFFFRAFGVIVSVMDEGAFVFHYHNKFDNHYSRFRSDVKGDAKYIRSKHKNYG